MITGFLKKVFGTKHARTIKKLWPLVERTNEFELEFQRLTEDQLKAKTAEFKERLADGESLDDLLPEAYAVVKNACRRLLGQTISVTGDTIEWDMVPYDVQVLGGIQLHLGGIAEMQTGEGKTLVAIMPLYLNALSGRNCQLVTTNDYLAKRDSEWVGFVLTYLRAHGRLYPSTISRPINAARCTRATSPTAPTANSASTICATWAWPHSREHMVQRDHYFGGHRRNRQYPDRRGAGLR